MRSIHIQMGCSPLSPNSYVSMMTMVVQKFGQHSRRHQLRLSQRRHVSFSARSTVQPPHNTAVSSPAYDYSPLSGLEDVMMGYISGKRKATEVTHSIWRHIIQKGDTLVDATCGNGYDTLAMVKMIADKSLEGHVYALDIQEGAMKNTSSLLKVSLHSDEEKIVKLFTICHSKMEEIVPKIAFIRLVAFNLGYLPGGDKVIITRSNTTIQALEAAKRILSPGGLISTLVYIGHPGGREELEAVEAFASGLPVETWICCKLQMLNRPLAPVLVLMLKKPTV